MAVVSFGRSYDCLSPLRLGNVNEQLLPPLQPPQRHLPRAVRRNSNFTTRISASSSLSVSSPVSPTPPPQPPQCDELVASILSKVMQTDRGVLLARDDHKQVAELAEALHKFCVAEPVKSPLIFGDWDVVYCSNPTSPGGGYRSAFGRLFFKASEMVQSVETPDVVKNKVSFSFLGGLDGEVTLTGKLNPLDERWIQVVFEPPELKIGAFDFRYGGMSEVKLEITYIDDKIRLGKGSRGSLFVFQRRTST